MVCLTYCIACAHGQHDGHIKDFEPAPPGVMGGSQCPCEGECVERYKPPALTDADPVCWDADDEHLASLFRGMRAAGET